MNDRRATNHRRGRGRSRVLCLAFLALMASGTGPGVRADDSHVNHRVKLGDTLPSLAKKYYGDSTRWPDILECNRWIQDPVRLDPGETIFIPNPSSGGGGWNFFGSPTRSSSPPVEPVDSSSGDWTRNPPVATASTGGSLKDLLRELAQAPMFGRPLYQILVFVAGWFLIHMLVQGCFTWFAAHMAFVKDVSMRKAWRATFQSEALAALFLGIVGMAGLAVIYVGTAPPGKPVLSQLLTIAEQYLNTPTGMAAGGLGMVALYIFLAIRFIPQNFEIHGGQGFAIVLLSVVAPHLTLLYVVGYRLGYVG